MIVQFHEILFLTKVYATAGGRVVVSRVAVSIACQGGVSAHPLCFTFLQI